MWGDEVVSGVNVHKKECGSCACLAGVVLTLRMVDNYGVEGDNAGVSSGDVPRGLCVGLQWVVQEGQALGVDREYDGYGYLREVRYSTSCKGGWSGGRM